MLRFFSTHVDVRMLNTHVFLHGASVCKPYISLNHFSSITTSQLPHLFTTQITYNTGNLCLKYHLVVVVGSRASLRHTFVVAG